ncbi:hypothetical protein L210DRAFT_3671727 [Boletus edulis BED1]|uniref:Uncharacterized protein n=1 Tax=Boletus edulis BED1 TaxID=1328754 RepID=A0AAD4BU01_BOLED|nr:hypothetical protein L210DRAFT_3671727 [Boletus edulis BED1]
MTSCPNSLDKFCINSPMGVCRTSFRNVSSSRTLTSIRTEGISRFIPSVPYFDNASAFASFKNKPGGLIHIMDDQARRSHKKTDLTMLGWSINRDPPHVHRQPLQWSRVLFLHSFLERNLDFLNPDSISLLRAPCWVILSQSHRHPSYIPRTKTPSFPLSTAIVPIDAEGPSADGNAGGSAVENRRDDDAPIPPLLNANDSQSPNQLEGRSLKGQIQDPGLDRGIEEECKRLWGGVDFGRVLHTMGVMDSSAKEKVEQTRNTLGLQETDIVLGQFKVFLSQAAFHSLEDRLRSLDVEEQKRNRLRDAEAEAGLDVRSIGNPYAPYTSPGLPPDDYADPYNQVSSQAHVPLVANASPFQRGNLYEDDYEDRKSFHSDDFDNQSRVTSNGEETNSNYGSESYAPSRNMFQNADKEGLIANEALAGEIMENETTEVVKETSARRRWVLLCWLLTWWIPSIFLKWFGRMKREDVRQAWWEKFALNVIIWFICACAVFVIPVLGVICPTEHVFSTSELASHSFSNSANNVYTAIRASRQHHPPTKSILQYGGQDATNLFPVQVSALCNSVPGSVSPWVQLSAANTTDLNAQYHDFRAVSNDSRPDWYFESMTIMRRNNRVGYMGYTPQEISSMVNTNRHALGSTTYSSGQDLTKAIDNLNTDSGTLAAQKTCLHNLFLIGMVDNRNSPQCLFLQRP